MFIKAPKDSRETWGTSLGREEKVSRAPSSAFLATSSTSSAFLTTSSTPSSAPFLATSSTPSAPSSTSSTSSFSAFPRVYVARAGRPVYHLDTFKLFEAAERQILIRLGTKPDIVRYRPGAPLTLSELQEYAPLIASGCYITKIRDQRCLTVNHLIEANAARRWVHQLLLLDHDAPSGIRTIAADNYARAMKHLARAFRHTRLIFASYPNGPNEAKEYLADTQLVLLHSLVQRCVACGWPVMDEFDALSHQLVQGRGLEAIY